MGASILLLSTLFWGAMVPAPSSAEGTGISASAAAAPRADFNGDGFDDLAIGSRTGLEGPDVGGVQVLYGSSDGLTTVGAQAWTQDSPGVSGIANDEDNFGSTLACGDFDGDGFSDLAVAAPTETLGFVLHTGVVHILFGSPAGLTADRDQLWSQQSAGVAGSPEEEDEFGYSLAAGDFDGSGQDDLAVGAREGIGSQNKAGAVHVLFGSGTGLTSTNSQLWHQGTAGVPGEPEGFDFFGYSLATGDVGRGRQADLIVGVPGESVGDVGGAGMAHVFYGTSTGLTATRTQTWSQDSAGIAGTPEGDAFGGDRFGAEIVVANFGHGVQADVAIAAPSESLGSIGGAGTVHLLYGSRDGVTAAGSQTWTQQSQGILGVPETGDGFGASLGAGFLANGSYADLAVGVAGEDVGSATDSGAIHVIRGSASGLTGSANQLWTQNSPGVADVAEQGDLWGASVEAGAFGADRQAALAVTAPGEKDGPGSVTGTVHVLPGAGNGLTAVGSQRWTAESPGLPPLEGVYVFGLALPDS